MISFSSKFLLISLCAGAAFAACGKTSDNELGDVGGGPGAGTAGEVGGANLLEVGGSANVERGGAGAGGMPTTGDECGHAADASAGSAGATDECSSPPPSVCADGVHLIYYSSAGCVAHFCQWTAWKLDCADVCKNGACVTSFTAK